MRLRAEFASFDYLFMRASSRHCAPGNLYFDYSVFGTAINLLCAGVPREGKSAVVRRLMDYV